MTLLSLAEKEVLKFFLIFFRVLLLFFLFPLFGTPFFPTRLKILTALVLALLLTPVTNFSVPQISQVYQLLIILASDFLLVFVISLLFRFILAGIQLGGEMVSIQMGFGISQTIDPVSGFSLPVISQFAYLIFLLFFFGFNFHHYLIYFLYESFEKIPPGTFLLKGGLAEFFIKKSVIIFDISIKFLAPLLVFMMLIYVTLAIIGRLMPQMNVLFVSFPLTLGLGLLFFGFMLVLLPRIIYPYFDEYFKDIFLLFKAF